MIRRGNRRQIVRGSINVLKRLHRKFVISDLVPASDIYTDDIIRNNLDVELCCDIFLGLDVLEAPFEVYIKDGQLVAICELEGEELDKEYVDIMEWIDNEEPDVLDAADSHQIDEISDIIQDGE